MNLSKIKDKQYHYLVEEKYRLLLLINHLDTNEVCKRLYEDELIKINEKIDDYRDKLG